MISGRVVRISQDRIVEKVRESGQRPIQSRFACRPPVGVVENQTQILGGNFANARIVE